MSDQNYRYRIKDRSAAKYLRQHAYAVNQVWNWCVGQQLDAQERYKAGAKPRRWTSGFDLGAQCNGVGRDLMLPQRTVQETCNKFNAARRKIKRSPKFRSSFGSLRALGWVPFHKQSRRIDGSSVAYAGKTYRWFGNKRRPLPDNAKGGAFVEDSLGRWWVTFIIEVPDPIPCVRVLQSVSTLALRH